MNKMSPDPEIDTKKRFLGHNKVWTAMVLIWCYIVLYALLGTSITPKKYDLKPGDIATETITATKDIEDVITTELEIQRVMDEVRPVMFEDTQVSKEMYDKFYADLQLLRESRALLNEDRNRLASEGLSREKIKEELKAFITPEILDYAMRITEPLDLPDKENLLESLLLCSDTEWSAIEDRAVKALITAKNSGIKEGYEKSALQTIEADFQVNLYSYNIELRSIAVYVLGGCLKANTFINEEETKLQRELAKESVTPTIYKKGQNIVKAGDVITLAQYTVINNLGLLNTEGFDVLPYVGIGLVLMVLMFVACVLCVTFMPELAADPRLQTLLAIIVIIVVLGAIGVEMLNVFLVPVTLGVLLITILFNYRLALVMNVILAVLVGLVATRESTVLSANTFNSAIACIVSGTAGAYNIRRRQHRSQVLLSGLIIGAMNLLTMLALGLVSTASVTQVLQSASWSAGGGLLASMLCIGVQPVLEMMFRIATPSKLLELSNPNQPLLKRLLIETPGTYHHSIIVANLAEAAAEVVDANALLARVGAYYHDIGKLKRPLYYKENQLGDNPHDRTDAAVSTAIITAHTTDGAELAAHLPRPIIDIILQHHGDTPVQYFYVKAREEAKDSEEVKLTDFRYSGPKPRTKEAAIVMLADTVEAATRSLKEPTPEKIASMIRKLVKAKFDDGQLDESPLLMADLAAIQEAFIQSLNGVYHERIEYPSIDIQGDNILTDGNNTEGKMDADTGEDDAREQTGWPAQQMGMSLVMQKKARETD